MLQRITGRSLCITSIWQEGTLISVILTARNVRRRFAIFADVKEKENEMKKVQWCGCMDVRSPKEGFKDIFSRELVDNKPRAELWELFEVKSFEEFKDELSDIAWGIGRIIGGFLGKVYVRVPGDGIHYEKVVARIEDYGCMRSKRFLVDGRCPNEEK